MKINSVYQLIFAEQIWGYFVADMDSCFRSAKNAQIRKYNDKGHGGQNFTAALLILSVIDFCTGYLMGKTRQNNGSPELTKADDVAVFMSRYFVDFPRFKDKFFSKQFYQVFRHGLAHSFSPKACGIGMNLNATEIFSIQNGTPVLEVKPFYELTIKAIKKYEEELGLNHELNDNFMKRFNYLIDRDKFEGQKFKAILLSG